MLKVSKEEYPYVLKHKEGCQGEAFYYKELPNEGDTIKSAFGIYPDGRKPTDKEPILCHQCKEELITIDEYFRLHIQVNVGYLERR